MLKTVPTERKRNALEDVTVTLLNNWMLFCVGVGLGVVDVATLLLEELISSLFSIFFSLSLSLSSFLQRMYVYVQIFLLLLLSLTSFLFLSSVSPLAADAK